MPGLALTAMQASDNLAHCVMGSEKLRTFHVVLVQRRLRAVTAEASGTEIACWSVAM